MSSPGQQAKQTPSDSGPPGWRPLIVLTALVAAVHALALQASPVHLSSGSRANNADDPGLSTLITRSIEPAPVAVTAAQPVASTAPVRRAAAKAVKSPEKSLKSPPNISFPQDISAPTAPETVASTEPEPARPPEAQAPVESPVVGTPTSTVAPLPVASQTTPVTALRLPGSVRLEYKVIGFSKNMNYHANAELAWKTDGDSYQAQMKVSAFLIGSRSMTSVGKINGSGLAPTRFADKFRAELAAHFEPEKGKITFSANTPDTPWVQGAQDRVSVFLQLGGMLAARPQDFPPGSNVSFLTIGPREADTWTFVIEAEENLELMGAPMAALKLTRKPRKEFDQKVEIWFAPSLGYLPVRSRITQHDGDFIDQQLTDVVKS